MRDAVTNINDPESSAANFPVKCVWMVAGVVDYKLCDRCPFDPDDLEHLVRNAIERKQLVSENIQLRSKIDEMNLFHEVVGNSC